MSIKTTDLCDEFPDAVEVAEPLFRSYGGQAAFHGPIATVRVHDDNVLVRRQLEAPGRGRVLVVDGGASLHCALLGDNLADMGRRNGWAGIVVNGCVRDSAELAAIPIGILALNTHPRKSGKQGHGESDQPVRFAGVQFRPGEHVYVDADGMLISAGALV